MKGFSGSDRYRLVNAALPWLGLILPVLLYLAFARWEQGGFAFTGGLEENGVVIAGWVGVWFWRARPKRRRI